jgi:hypothetical protein
VPALDATTEQVYVATLLAATGPVVEVQAVTPDTPVIIQLPVPDGATAVAGPVTIAVNEMVPPRFPVDASALTITFGVTAVTVVVVPEVGATAK